MSSSPRFLALVPAAGAGSRMGADCPKQYLPLAGQPMLWHALRALLEVPRMAAVYVVLAPDDVWWERFDWSPLGSRLHVLRCGGETRAQTVRQALAMVGAEAPDWVLVHDAARACLTSAEVERLIDTLYEDPVGGLLASPVADTMKRADGEGRVADTVPREGLWQAQTPQMFRHGLLRRALDAQRAVTDEASAVEALGLAPRLVAAEAPNFKITWPQDMWLAEQLLQSREGQAR